MTEHKINIVDFAATKLAVLEHHGEPDLVSNSVKKFIDWRKQYGLSPAHSKTFNLLYADPQSLPPEQFQLDICASTPTDIPDNDSGIINKTIPAGRCAVLRHIGSDNGLNQSFEQLFTWLAQSGEILRDFPCFIERVVLYPDANESEMISDIYLPLV
jgi:AraC family transcriptional regulator